MDFIFRAYKLKGTISKQNMADCLFSKFNIGDFKADDQNSKFWLVQSISMSLNKRPLWYQGIPIVSEL